MTPAQWLFEYHALVKREEEAREREAKAMESGTLILREVLVGVLGLNLLAPSGAEKLPGGGTPFMPGAFIFGNHHLLSHHLDAQKKSESETKAMEDADFEAFSAKLAKGETGDMDPILLGAPIENAAWNSEEMQQMLRALGVRPRTETTPVPHVSARPRVAAPTTGGVRFTNDESDEVEA